MTHTTRPSATPYPDDPRRADALRLGARNGSGVGQDRHRIASTGSDVAWWLVFGIIGVALVGWMILRGAL